MKVKYQVFIVLSMVLLLLPQPGLSQTMDTVITGITFKFRTSTPHGNFSPKNIGAVWIENDQDQFVKTLKRWADRRKQYLYTWKAKSGGNVVDAVTTATLTSHKSHTVHWNLTNVAQDTMPDGQYQMRIEMTDKHAQGPVRTCLFTIGAKVDTLFPADGSFFHDLMLSYEYNVVTGISSPGADIIKSFELGQNYPNPFNPQTRIHFKTFQPGSFIFQIFDVSGRVILEERFQTNSVASHLFFWNGRNEQDQAMAAGVYFYRLTGHGFSKVRKMVLLK